jgi:hypothetical protein
VDLRERWEGRHWRPVPTSSLPDSYEKSVSEWDHLLRRPYHGVRTARVRTLVVGVGANDAISPVYSARESGMSAKTSSTLISKSGQAWKLVLGLCGSGLTFAVMVYGVRGGSAPGNVELAMGSAVLGLSVMAITCLSIRCRKCGMRWLWAAVRYQSHLQWFNWLVAQRTCPRCGDDPSVPADKHELSS